VTGRFEAIPARRERLALVGLALFVAAGHIAHLPIWLSVVTLGLFVWQGWAHWHERPAPPGWLRAGATLGVFACVFFGIGQITGQTAGVALLALMTTLKLSELEKQRDSEIVLLLCCFVLATEFLFSQSLAMAAYLVAGLLAIVTVFVYVHTQPGAGRLRHAIGEAATLTAWAVPLAAACFVLFPRLPGPLWSIERDNTGAGVTGLSDRMSPGSISQLATSEAVAFRARFSADAPPPDQRYWRGPVLWDSVDGSWMNRDDRRDLPAADVVPRGPTTRVTMTLEPRDQPWLIALDTPLAANRDFTQRPGATLVADTPITERIRYTTRSATRRALDPQLARPTRRRASALPPAGNPRTRALAERLAAESTSTGDLIDHTLAWFAARDFVYTLSPPASANRDRVDQFLFDDRAGFCEHYASALVWLMRAAGVPARVVTGYLGGEHALYGDYWIIRDADAHAWAEVWRDEVGWQRVDATRIVAPARIERGPAFDGASSSGSHRNGGSAFLGGLLYRTRMGWDAVNAEWNRWFLAYGPALQTRLLGRLGLADYGRAIAVLTITAVLCLGVISALMGWRMRPTRSRDRVVVAWQRVERRMARAGWPRGDGEPAGAWAARLHDAGAPGAHALVALAESYETLRYRPGGVPGDVRAFRRATRRFRAR